MAYDVIKIARDISKTIGKENIRDLSRINQLRSAGLFLAEWVMIVGMIIIANKFWHPLLYVVAVMFIGARMHAFIGLIHDGAHYLMFKNKKLNDAVTSMFASWPLFFSMLRYRTHHLPHHRYLNTTKDPDFVMLGVNEEYVFPKTRKEMIMMFIRDLTGISLITGLYQFLERKYFEFKYGKPGLKKFYDNSMGLKYYAYKYIYYLVLIPAIVYFFGWEVFVFYWLVPFATWFQFIFRLRTIAEHYALPDENIMIGTRNVFPNILEKAFLVPMNLNYHLDHHLFPSVPLHKLPQLHKLLMTDETYRTTAYNGSSYLNVVKECVMKGPSFAA